MCLQNSSKNPFGLRGWSESELINYEGNGWNGIERN